MAGSALFKAKCETPRAFGGNIEETLTLCSQRTDRVKNRHRI